MKPKKQKRASRNVSRRAHIEKLKAGVGAWNAWSVALREQDPGWRADLRDANLPGLRLRDDSYIVYKWGPWPVVDLRRAILSGANLKGADLSGCDLRSAKFRGADLEGATLDFSDLRGANFDKANLNGVSLYKAKLQGAQFLETRVDGAGFRRARIGNTFFVDMKLDGASGLEEVNHYGPSRLSLSTLTQSGGRLPSSFLRGCGVAPLVQVMLGGDRTERRHAFDDLNTKGFPVELPQRYVMYLFHGWRARAIHRALNEYTEFSWNLFNLSNIETEPDPLRQALRGMKKGSTVIVLFNPIMDDPKDRTIFKQLEKARRRRRLKILLLCVPWRKHHLYGLVKHRRIVIRMMGSSPYDIEKISGLLA